MFANNVPIPLPKGAIKFVRAMLVSTPRTKVPDPQQSHGWKTRETVETTSANAIAKSIDCNLENVLFAFVVVTVIIVLVIDMHACAGCSKRSGWIS
jgi:hypothetical protein